MAGQGILERILENKRLEVARARERVSVREVREAAEARRDLRPFEAVLARENGVHVIAEIKRASPSKGPIRPDLSPADLARAYEAGGAAALSVLCDETFFGAHPGDLAEARAACALPVMRKDFIVDLYQVYETAAMGADALLLIVRAVSREFLRDALALASSLGLGVLAEVHGDAELDKALAAGARVVGVNNRDLATFTVDLGTTERLAARMGPGTVAVAESGISAREHVARLLWAGVSNFLVGESLVRADDPAALLRELRGVPA